MDKLLTAYEFVELSPGPDKLLDEAVARLHEIDKGIAKMDDKIEKIMKETVANLICYFIDNYKEEGMSEEALRRAGIDFLFSRHNTLRSISPEGEVNSCSNCGDKKCKASQESSSVVKKCGQWKPKLKDSDKEFVAAMRRRKRGQSYSPKDVFSLCEIIDNLEDENRQWQETTKAAQEYRDCLIREAKELESITLSGEKVIMELKGKIKTSTIKELDVSLIHTKEICKLKKQIQEMTKNGPTK